MALVSFMVRCFGPASVGGDEGEVDVGFHGGGKLALGFLRCFLEALQGHLVAAQIDPLVLVEFVGDPVDDLLVEVLAPQEGVAVGRLDLEHPFSQFENGDVEGSAAQVEDRDLFFLLSVHAVGKGRGGRLVDDPKHIEAGDLARVLGRLPLGIVKIGRDRNDRIGDRFAQVILGGLFHLLQNGCGDLRRRIFLAAHIHPGIAVVGPDDLERGDGDVPFHHVGIELAADEALDGEQGVLRIGDRLALGLLADENLAALGERHHGRGGAAPLRIGYDNRLPPLHNGHAGVGGAQIDSDNFTHID